MKINPLQAFVWGNNFRDGVKHLPTITFKGYVRINTNTYPHTNRKLFFDISFKKYGEFIPYYIIEYDNGHFKVKKLLNSDTQQYVQVPLSDVGSVQLKSFHKLSNMFTYEIDFNFTYEVSGGVIIKGIAPDNTLLNQFRVFAYTLHNYTGKSLINTNVEENPRNFDVIGTTGERNTPTDNVFGFYTLHLSDHPSQIKTLPNLYGINTISVSHL